MIISNSCKTTITAIEANTNQVETEIPMITEDDYNKPMLPVHLKTEVEQTHFFEPIHPVKRIVCQGPNCPLCDAKLPRDTEKLLPVYSIEEKMIKILRIPLDFYPFSLFSGMRKLVAGKAPDQVIFYKTPFMILSEGYVDDLPGAFGIARYPLVRVELLAPLQDGEYNEIMDNCVSRFLEGYRSGDLCESANIQVSEKVMKISLEKNLEKNLGKNPEHADIADFMEPMPAFEIRTERIGKLV